MKPTIVIIGAGSVEFTRELLGDILSFPELGSVRVVLHDIDDERLETAEAIARATARAAGAEPEVVATSDRRRALDGANYVINVIAVGMHEATVRDFEIPARYGLNQTIADTIGVGGIFRGLRTFPVLAGIARDMAEVCPDAWLLNYTNPMAMNVTFLHRVAPQLKVLGLCHSVYWTMVGLCELIDVPYDEVSYWSAGVNHQAWVLRWERGGENLYPLLDQRIAADPELRRRVRVDMYRRLGYYPTETSEHSSEYVPWYLHHPDEIERLRINVGEYVSISEANLAEYAPRASRIGGHADAADRHRVHGVRPPGDPLAGDRDAAGHLRQRRQRRADHQPARRGGRRSADAAGRAWRAPDEGRRPAAAVRGAQPQLPRPGGPRGARRRRGRSAPGARGGHGRPEHRGDADRRPDLGTVRRPDRRAR